jgi:hypothetical protein
MQNPRCVLVVGPPGAGKSFTVDDAMKRYGLPLKDIKNDGCLDLSSLFTGKLSELKNFKIDNKSINDIQLAIQEIIKKITIQIDRNIDEWLREQVYDKYYDKTYNFSVDNLVSSTNIPFLVYKLIQNTKFENDKTIKGIVNEQVIFKIKDFFGNVNDSFINSLTQYYLSKEDCESYSNIAQRSGNGIIATIESIFKMSDSDTLDKPQMETLKNILIRYDTSLSSILKENSGDCNKLYKNNTNNTSDATNPNIINFFKKSREKMKNVKQDDNIKEIEEVSRFLTNIYSTVRRGTKFFIFKDRKMSIDDLNDAILDYLIKNKINFVFEFTMENGFGEWYYEQIIKLYQQNYKITCATPIFETKVHKLRLISRLYDAILKADFLDKNAEGNLQLSLNIDHYKEKGEGKGGKPLNKFYEEGIYELIYVVNEILLLDARSFRNQTKYVNQYNSTKDILYKRTNYMECDAGMCFVIYDANNDEVNFIKNENFIDNGLEIEHKVFIEKINNKKWMIPYVHQKYINLLIKRSYQPYKYNINIDFTYDFTKKNAGLRDGNNFSIRKNFYTQKIKTYLNGKILSPNIFDFIERSNRDSVAYYRDSYKEVMKNYIKDYENSPIKYLFLKFFENYMDINLYSIISAMYGATFKDNFHKINCDDVNQSISMVEKLNEIVLKIKIPGNISIGKYFLILMVEEILVDILSNEIASEIQDKNEEYNFMHVRVENCETHRFKNFDDCNQDEKKCINKSIDNFKNNKKQWENTQTSKVGEGIFNADSKFCKTAKWGENEYPIYQNCDIHSYEDSVVLSGSDKLSIKTLLNYCCADWEETISEGHIKEIGENYKIPGLEEFMKDNNEKKQSGDYVCIDVRVIPINSSFIFDKNILDSTSNIDEERKGQSQEILFKEHFEQILISDTMDNRQEPFPIEIKLHGIRPYADNNIEIKKTVKSNLSLYRCNKLGDSLNYKLNKLNMTFDTLKKIKIDSLNKTDKTIKFYELVHTFQTETRTFDFYGLIENILFDNDHKNIINAKIKTNADNLLELEKIKDIISEKFKKEKEKDNVNVDINVNVNVKKQEEEKMYILTLKIDNKTDKRINGYIFLKDFAGYIKDFLKEKVETYGSQIKVITKSNIGDIIEKAQKNFNEMYGRYYGPNVKVTLVSSGPLSTGGNIYNHNEYNDYKKYIKYAKKNNF